MYVHLHLPFILESMFLLGSTFWQNKPMCDGKFDPRPAIRFSLRFWINLGERLWNEMKVIFFVGCTNNTKTVPEQKQRWGHVLFQDQKRPQFWRISAKRQKVKSFLSAGTNVIKFLLRRICDPCSLKAIYGLEYRMKYSNSWPMNDRPMNERNPCRKLFARGVLFVFPCQFHSS